MRSHFYGTVEGHIRTSGRCGSKAYGISTVLFTKNGAIKVRAWHDRDTDEDRYEISYIPHMEYRGDVIVLSEGSIAKIPTITGAQSDG